jgi:hypothetical protein
MTGAVKSASQPRLFIPRIQMFPRGFETVAELKVAQSQIQTVSLGNLSA